MALWVLKRVKCVLLLTGIGAIASQRLLLPVTQQINSQMAAGSLA